MAGLLCVWGGGKVRKITSEGTNCEGLAGLELGPPDYQKKVLIHSARSNPA